MPELPEVETVRGGLARHVVGRVISSVEVGHPRAVRRHEPGPADFARRLEGARVLQARRRGKYLWLPVELGHAGGRGTCVLAHLGMSGQLLVQDAAAPDPRHLHVRFRFEDAGPELRFADQRTFGGLALDHLTPTGDGHPASAEPSTEGSAQVSAHMSAEMSSEMSAGVSAAGTAGPDTVPARIAHIARDPLDPAFDDARFARRLRARRTELKRALLDQTLVSGIGNIYADEALWRAKLSGLRRTDSLSRPTVAAALAAAREVMTDALAAGGTSFDALYVNVNGQSGYFDRSLAVYGQEGRACPRCGAVIRRASFMNRSSFTCPRCQPAPRRTSA